MRGRYCPSYTGHAKKSRCENVGLLFDPKLFRLVWKESAWEVGSWGDQEERVGAGESRSALGTMLRIWTSSLGAWEACGKG